MSVGLRAGPMRDTSEHAMQEKAGPVRYVFESPGWCPICEAPTTFVAERDTPLEDAWFPHWFRGSLICHKCASIPRHRALFTVLQMLYPGWRDLDIHESSPSDGGASRRIRAECKSYTETQYDPALGFGRVHPSGRYRSENLEAQTFPSECFDLVITQDVFEHIFAPDRAIREIARTLRPGGAHILTVPIVRGMKPSLRRARFGNGTVEHLMPPEYHGNPMSPDGSLATVDWGYDIVDYFTAHSGLAVSLFYFDDLPRGMKAVYIDVLVCKKALSLPIL